jgi:hypothetical protein
MEVRWVNYQIPVTRNVISVTVPAVQRKYVNTYQQWHTSSPKHKAYNSDGHIPVIDGNSLETASKTVEASYWPGWIISMKRIKVLLKDGNSAAP